MVTADRPDAGASVDIHVGPERAPYEHALADAEFRARVGGGYAGTHDLLDALWWLEHPLEPGPSGAMPPTSLLDIARRVLYAPTSTAETVGRYLESLGRERRDHDSLQAAVAAMDQPDGAAPRPALGESVAASPPVPSPPASGPFRRLLRGLTERRGRWMIAGSGAALVLVALLGWARPTAGAADGPAHAATPAVPPAERIVLVEVHTGDGSVLQQGPAAPGHGVRVLSRRLAVVGGTTVSASLTHGLICLEVRTGTRASSTCRTHREFASSGLEVPSPTGSPSIAHARWLADGRLRLWTVR